MIRFTRAINTIWMLVCCCVASAATQDPINEKLQARIILEMNRKLSQYSSCDISPLSSGNIIKMGATSIGGVGATEYAVLWIGDYGCSRGNDSIAPYLTRVKVTSGRIDIPDPGLGVIPELTKIEYVVGPKDGQILIRGWAKNVSDANYDPSIHEEILIVPKGAGWRLLRKQTIAPN